MSEFVDVIAEVGQGRELGAAEVEVAVAALVDEGVGNDLKADFLKGLATKGETPGEIAAFVEGFVGRAVDPGVDPAKASGPLLDVCGTGGDKLDLFNVSTTSTFVLAGGGVTVVKHGNRGITSKSGGADVLEALGVPIDLTPERLADAIHELGVGFLFAPLYHPAFKAVVPVRKALAEEGQRTIFNILGPLLNPTRPDYQVIGVFDPSLPPVFADILGRMGRKAAWAVHGQTADGQGVDELSTMGPTQICATSQERGIEQWGISPEDLGLSVGELEDLQGGDARENAGILRSILDGTERGAKRDLVLLNAAAGFVVTGLAESLEAGLTMGGEVIDSGKAIAKLDALCNFGR